MLSDKKIFFHPSPVRFLGGMNKNSYFCTKFFMMKRLLFFAFLLVAFATAVTALPWEQAVKKKNKAPKSYVFRFYLRDKAGCGASLQQPRSFLSRAAIERRKRQHLALDSTDLPVSRTYLKLLDTRATRIVGKSKWNNTVLVAVEDTAAIAPLRQLPCVRGCRLVWQSPDSIIPPAGRPRYHETFNPWDSVKTSRFGQTEEQLRMLNGVHMQLSGFTGRNVTIAVLDGGFLNVDRIPAFSSVRILGTCDFVYPPSPGGVFAETDHGTKVLSTMAVNEPNVYVGAAPDASYWLLRCEDQQSEQPIEEDHWAMAAEFADSAGVDIINSSLGYNEFDNRLDNHTYREMDGRSTLISRTASLLAGKGIILINSAGNYGMTPWKKITFPADAFDILAVGSVNSALTNSAFCGVGPTQDGRVKPDVMALGSATAVITGRGTIIQDMGTSFAAPIVCGLTACLWQALPQLTARDIISLVRRSGNNFRHPDNIYGYGIPDIWRAYVMGRLRLEDRENQF